jgi:hypothetical protein
VLAGEQARLPGIAPRVWLRGREPSHALAALAVAVTLTLVVADTWMFATVGLLFDLGFVLLCGGLALAVRPGEFIVVGLFPPVVMLAVFTLFGLTTPGVIAHPDDGVVQAVVSGVSHHSLALFVGYAGCLGCLGYRQHLLDAQSQARSRDSLPPGPTGS